MIERERLIEIICEGLAQNCGGNCTLPNKMYCQNCHILADYLLANGVKPLPLKINDIVYGISRGQIIPIQINTIQYTKRGIDISGSKEEYFGYSTIHLDINNQIGIQWYKTKEEAKKVLEAENENHNRNT